MARPVLLRSMAWLALAGPVLFAASWLVAGALQVGYSHADQPISELGSRFAYAPAVVNAGFVVLGVSIASIAPGLWATLPRGRAAAVAVGLLVVAGALMAAMGLLPLDCSFGTSEECRDRFRAGELSAETDFHVWLGLPLQLALVASPFAIGAALRRNALCFYAYGAGLVGLVVGLSGTLLAAGELVPDGLVNRLSFAFLHAWLAILAVAVLHTTHRPRRPGALVPLAPRDFLGRPWIGEGELAPRPLSLGRRIAVRFAARRVTTWVSENVWLMQDEARFADGRVLRRQMFCEFVGADRARLTAGDLPDGADVRLEEGGYRMAPFRMSFALGPVRVVFDCRDASWLDGDGTFVYVTEVRTVGLRIPVARLTFRVPPVQRSADQSEVSGGSTRAVA